MSSECCFPLVRYSVVSLMLAFTSLNSSRIERAFQQQTSSGAEHRVGKDAVPQRPQLEGLLARQANREAVTDLDTMPVMGMHYQATEDEARVAGVDGSPQVSSLHRCRPLYHLHTTPLARQGTLIDPPRPGRHWSRRGLRRRDSANLRQSPRSGSRAGRSRRQWHLGGPRL
jgi:hypothetical protein